MGGHPWWLLLFALIGALAVVAAFVTLFLTLGRRPGRMSHEPTFDSWMRTLGSREMPNRSFAESPVTMPPEPQW